MLKKRKRAKKAKVDTPVEELDEEESLVHYSSVLIEETNSRMKLVLEVMQVMSYRVDRLGQAVQANTERLDRIESRVGTLESAFRGLKDDMLDMERRICSKLNRITERCESHDCRINALEAGH